MLAGMQNGSADSCCKSTNIPLTLPSLPCWQMEEVLSLNEDYIFLKKVQKCQTAEGQKSTLLDCEKILKGFQNIQCKVRAVGWIKIPLKGERGSQSHTELHPKLFFKTMDTLYFRAV